MQRATTEVLYFEIGPENRPTMTVQPGEVFEVQTQLNRGPWIDTHPQGDELRQRLYGGNPSSGCIYIEGAEPGQVLTVHVGPIDLDPLGFTAFGGSNGAMPGWLGGSGVGRHHRIVEIHDGIIEWDDHVRLLAAPMLGYVGIAPARERYHNGWAGQWGGNFDAQEVTTGAAVHLVVNVPGALLHVGDMHALQGDGEICGAGGIEASGRVQLRCELSPRPASMHWPRLVNQTHIAVMAMAKPAEDAFRHALADMVLWLQESYGYTRGEAYLYLGQVLEARCTQFVNPTFTYIAKVARRRLPTPVTG
ncbi:MAG: acetamidase/formamidase family protein [Anaerolineae bacterium]|nr:acetamidase/formamidase family protein [Anaerolineae bacterium]